MTIYYRQWIWIECPHSVENFPEGYCRITSLSSSSGCNFFPQQWHLSCITVHGHSGWTQSQIPEFLKGLGIDLSLASMVSSAKAAANNLGAFLTKKEALGAYKYPFLNKSCVNSKFQTHYDHRIKILTYKILNTILEMRSDEKNQAGISPLLTPWKRVCRNHLFILFFFLFLSFFVSFPFSDTHSNLVWNCWISTDHCMSVLLKYKLFLTNNIGNHFHKIKVQKRFQVSIESRIILMLCLFLQCIKISAKKWLPDANDPI